jgi:hypothetical protein
MFNFSLSIIRKSVMRFLCFGIVSALSLLLAGCIGEKQTLIWDTFKAGIVGNDSLINSASLNPRYRYLRVQVNGQSALLVLGYEDKKPGMITQTWYSSAKEVLQLQNGRLIGTGGLDVNWIDVTLIDAPAITTPELFPEEIAGSTKRRRNPKLFFFRTRSVMPQYEVNIHEAVVMQGLDEAPDDLPKILRDSANLSYLRWVQESVIIEPNNPSIQPLRAVYAYDKRTQELVFGRQCLRPNECLSWLVWPYETSNPSSVEVKP